MTLTLLNIAVRGPRRLRLTYSQQLTVGSYEPSFFSIQCLDSSSADPGINTVFLVPGLSSQMEFALSLDLAPGGSYQITALAGIPAQDGSFSIDEVAPFRVPRPQPAPSTAVSANDVSALLYGVDLLHDGDDLVETADGDLATITGPANAINALARIGVSEGLPYDSSYGAKLRKYVDAPSPLARSARGDLERALRRDDRAKRVAASVGADNNDGELTINADVTLVGKTKHSFSKAVT